VGYYTNYNLTIPEGVDEAAVLSRLVEISGYSELKDGCVSSIKWYEWWEDMKRLSLEYPNNVFELIGEGEEAGDLWKAYFKDGKMQVCVARIEYDAYDERRLK